ncbi:MAG: efflux RND transporter periplasmic adaptor subunit [Bacteroidaceae bacterium]|nr:efflux RND transporter periplasmic adaptor subunit [Bacteroidaceae bacterium]
MIRKSYLAFFVGIATLTSCAEKEIKTENNAVSVKTEQVHATADYDVMPYVGTVEASNTTTVSFTSMGIVQKVLFDEGQTVRKGQLIATLDPTQARNSVEAADATLRQAKDAISRYKQLHDNGSLPEIQWVEAQSKLQQAQASYDMAKKMLDDCNLYAPTSGIVGKRYVGAGETALPAQAVLSILDVNNVKVLVSIPEKEIGSIKASTPSTIKVEALGGASFNGGKIEKGVQADAITRTYNAKISVQNNGQRLLPGMVCNVRFGNGKGNEKMAITVPVTAVQKGSDGQMFVWKANGNKAVRSNVRTGESIGNRIVVEDGLTNNDIIITEGYQKISDGSEIKM